MWAILVFAYILSMFHAMTTAIFQPYLIDEFHLTTSQITHIGSMFFYSYLIMQLPTGLLVDRLSPKTVSFYGLLCATLGSLFFASAQSIFMLYVSRTLIGLGIATIFVCVLKFQVAWLKPQIHATMTGLACFIGMLGGMVAQSPLAYVVEVFGWRNVVYAISFLTFLNALLVCFCLKNPSPQSEIETKKQLSLLPYFIALRNILCNRHVWPPLMVYAVGYGSYIVLVGYSGTSWLNHIYNMNVLEASSYIIFIILGCALSYIAIGTFADRIHSKKIPMLVWGALYAICWGILAYYPYPFSPAFLIVLLFCIGAFSSGYVLSFACVQEISPKEYSGLAGAVVNMGGYLGPIFIPNLFVSAQNSHIEYLSNQAFKNGFEYIFYLTILCFFYSFWIKETRPENIDKKPL